VSAPELEREFRPVLPVDLSATLTALARGFRDPSLAFDPSGEVWRATRTAAGPATIRLSARSGVIRASAWGAGAELALALVPELCGARDSLSGFSPDGIVGRLHRAHPGLRIPRSRAVFERLLIAIVGQKVSGREATRSRFALARAWGAPAPGPRSLALQPALDQLARKSYFDFHPLGVERRRAETIIAAARVARQLEALVDVALPVARQRLLSLPGVGEWTAAEVLLSALGDSDAVAIGDYNLPSLVAYNLAGERHADDTRMLELLAPFAGHRGRVLCLIAAGGAALPRRGPRHALRDFRRH
jgi:3-methyladenine DNA glycosylase/8-oxoguanine DNA glycosylase